MTFVVYKDLAVAVLEEKTVVVDSSSQDVERERSYMNCDVM